MDLSGINNNEDVLIVIPSLEPDNRLLTLLHELNTQKAGPIIIINDGSLPEYDHYFDEAKEKYGATIIKHAHNMGKGAALKSAFSYILDKYPKAIGCVTADSDGQHTAKDIAAVVDALRRYPQKMVLGVRTFDKNIVPFKSRFGNILTRFLYHLLYGIKLSDTQTGLRAIPSIFMKDLLMVKGDRFEFETHMLIEAKNLDISICEVPISTVYDSKEHHATHFKPLLDSIRIYRVLFGQFMRYAFASLSSALLDLLLFHVFCRLFQGHFESVIYASVATVSARIISATYNFLLNYYYSFHSREDIKRAAVKYTALALISGFSSASLVAYALLLVKTSKELFVKIPIDAFLFLLNYYIERRIIYKRSKGNNNDCCR